MKRSFPFFFLIAGLFFFQCKKEVNTDFLISSNSFGNLNNTDTLNDLEIIFTKDSVVLDTTSILMNSNTKSYYVFEKGGKPLFSATNSKKDSLKIKTIRILDARYKTSEGIGLNSTFGEIRKNYTIKKILSTRQNIIVTLNENDLYFTISREELPSNLRYNNADVEIANIPDVAKIKYLMLDWE